MSFVAIITIIYGFGIRGAIGRYYYEDADDFFQFYSSNFWMVLLFGTILTSIGITYIDQIQSFIQIPKGMIIIGLIVAVPLALFQFYQSFLIASKNSKRFSKLSVYMTFVSTALAVIIIFQLTDEKYYAKAIAQLITVFIFIFITIYSLSKHISFTIDKKHLKYSVIFGFPIVLHLLSQNILSSFDQIIINQTIDSYHAGLYSVAYKIGVVQSIFSMAILKAWTPIFYEKMNNLKTEDIASLARKYSFIVILVAVLLITFSKEILFVAADKSYHEALRVITVVVFSYFFLFLYTLYVNYAFYFKKTKSISIITITAGLVNIILNYLLIPIYGYEMAAWTTLFSYLLLFFLHYFNAKHHFKDIDLLKLKTFVIPTILLLLVGSINYSVYSFGMNYFTSLILRLSTLALVAFIIYKQVTQSKVV
jgi:O-antigen/teichoic acid export membrane protein